MDFRIVATAIAKQFQEMTATGLFRVEADKDKLWETYLASFPAGTNPIYKTRPEYDCQCCRSFIRTLGGVVTIKDGELVSIWDVTIPGFFQEVVDAMAALVKGCEIENVFLHTERTAGAANSRQLLEDKTVKTWDHFFVNLPANCVVRGVDIGTRLSDTKATHDVMLRGLCEITPDAVDTVLELIAQNSLYRGEEHKNAVTEFRKLQQKFLKLNGKAVKDRFVWASMGASFASAARIRNTVIGTLLVDLSEGVDLDSAVKTFEAKVAPANYKRPTALVTKAMIQNAQKTVDELGLASALERRYAVLEDLTINNVLYADRTAKKSMSVFDEIAATVPEGTKKLDKVEEVGIEDFLEKILPKAESVEVMLENKHCGNLVSLIAPADPTAKRLFKWPNNFSWSYTGDMADSIKERVKAAGGSVTGDFRASLSWFNYDDLDLHLVEPGGNEIYYGNPRSVHMGHLDVDMNAGRGTTRTPVENITYPNRSRMMEGMYRLFVHNYMRRETQDIGFDVEMEFDGVTHSFSYAKPTKTGETADVCTFKYTHKGGIEIVKSLPSSQSTKTVWGVQTQTFHKVNVVMLSPNHWDEKAVGNKHYFFMLEGCQNEGKARGFYNEFLSAELDKHRKVLEIVGAKMKTDESDRQLSGLGFSSTQRNQLLCRVKGAFTRTIKIVF